MPSKGNNAQWAYYRWLVAQIDDTAVAVERMFDKDFVWYVPNDDNRCQDAKDLRAEFYDRFGIRWDPPVCNVLEVLVALSRRLAFEADGEPCDWFWEMYSNLTFARCVTIREIDEIIDRFVWRTYAPNGEGGVFPLKTPKEDQREVELWYQMSAYLLERLD